MAIKTTIQTPVQFVCIDLQNHHAHTANDLPHHEPQQTEVSIRKTHTLFATVYWKALYKLTLFHLLYRRLKIY